VWNEILKEYQGHYDYIPFYNLKSSLLVKEHYFKMKERKKEISISIIGDKGIKSNLVRSFLGYPFLEEYEP
jgi:hypothetical protein